IWGRMVSLADRESLGDWSVLKGTEYHLIYALWLLIRRRVGRLWFYRGNDLYTFRPSAPPGPSGITEHSGPISLKAESGHVDEWIQLKSTRDDWHVSDLLKGNLLRNFVGNALASEDQ